MVSRTRRLTDVKGIGEATAVNLVGVGIDSIEALAAASTEEISVCPGFGPARANAVKRAANELLVTSTREERPAALPEPARRAPEKAAVKAEGAKKPKNKKENPKMAKKKKADKKKADKKKGKKKADKKKGKKGKKKGKKG